MAKRILVCERCQAVCKHRHTCRTCKRLCCENGCCVQYGNRYGGETWWGCCDEGACATRDLPPEAYRPRSPPPSRADVEKLWGLKLNEEQLKRFAIMDAQAHAEVQVHNRMVLNNLRKAAKR